MTSVQAACGKSTAAASELIKAPPPVTALAGVNLRAPKATARHFAQTQFPSLLLLLCGLLTTALLCCPGEAVGLWEKKEVPQVASLQGVRILHLLPCMFGTARREGAGEGRWLLNLN